MNTAYQYDARLRKSDEPVEDYGWAPEINRLLAQRQQFLPLEFGPGVLFRALPEGGRKHCDNNGLGLLRGTKGVTAQEEALGVMLMTHELSDALAIARLWDESFAEAVILVIDAAAFSDGLRRRAAGVLAFAEPGVVFRYPFMVPPLEAADIQAVICTSRTSCHPPGVTRMLVSGSNRNEISEQIKNLLADKNLEAAKPVPSPCLPTRC